MIQQSAKVAIHCDEKGCTLPAGHLKDGVLLIESHHHGKKHTTIIRVEALDKTKT